ncbi:MAG: oligosaccharide repeat unit polymerase [Alistipes sp.]|nr:oligosaccharide repeat unit polymerase [Alistipes sp.]
MMKVKRLSLFHVWICSYIFIILSEMLILSIDDYLGEYTIPIFFYLLANNIVLVGYRLYKPKSQNIIKSHSARNTSALFISLIILMVVYMIMNYERVIQTAYLGRNETVADSNPFLGGFIESLGILLPCFWGYYFRYIKPKSVLYSILLSAPIFIYQFILATRFKLLFTLLPFLFITGITTPSLNNTKKNILFVVIAILFGFASSYLKDSRNSGSLNSDESAYIGNMYANEEPKDIFHALALNMSPEGVIYMAKKADDYFANNPLSYGKETAYILYFWVPRAIWPDKPTMLGNWLIRKTEIVSDTHSTSSGFLGELRADFGWFSLVFALLIGFLLKHCELYIRRFSHSIPNVNYIMAVALYSYFFFFVRSPLTATLVLIGEYIVFLGLKHLFFYYNKTT